MQRTNSLIAPYVSSLHLNLIPHYTVFNKSRDEAAADTDFVQATVYLHHHIYGYQEDTWVPQSRRFHTPDRDQLNAKARALLGQPDEADAIEWLDCTAPMGGQTDIRGCLEEFDDATPRS